MRLLEPDPMHTPFTAKHPAAISIPFWAVVVAPPRVSCPVMVVDAFRVVDALDTNPLRKLSVVEVEFPTNG